MLFHVITILILLAVLYLLARPVVRGAIFFPTNTESVEIMLDLAELHPCDRVVDLGSGDGRILIACARRGIRAEGYEINPILVLRSCRRIRRAGLENFAKVHWKSFWRVNLARYDAIFMFGIPRIMGGLRKKFEHELHPGTKVVAYVFPFAEWTPLARRGKVYLYEIAAKHPKNGF
jgi:cyclopropane fatty-acyl-phospholipid synthase-like methyltransferase